MVSYGERADAGLLGLSGDELFIRCTSRFQSDTDIYWQSIIANGLFSPFSSQQHAAPRSTPVSPLSDCWACWSLGWENCEVGLWIPWFVGLWTAGIVDSLVGPIVDCLACGFHGWLDCGLMGLWIA